MSPRKDTVTEATWVTGPGSIRIVIVPSGFGAAGAAGGVAVAVVGGGIAQPGRRHDLDHRRKMAQRGEQLAQVGGGLGDQAPELVGVEVAQLAKALQLHVAQQELAHRLGRLHVDLEARPHRGAGGARAARRGGGGGRCGFGGVGRGLSGLFGGHRGGGPVLGPRGVRLGERPQECPAQQE
jgi:hypothetical protein